MNAAPNLAPAQVQHLSSNVDVTRPGARETARPTARIDAADLKRQVGDLRRFIERYDLGAPVRENPKYAVWYNPWRDDHDPSLFVYANDFFDYATAEFGDVFTYLERRLNLPFKEAKDYLIGLLGGVIPEPGKPDKVGTPKVKPAQPLEWRQAAERVVRKAEAALWADTPAATLAQAYLAERGYTEATIRTHHAGVIEHWQPFGFGKGKVAPGILFPNFNSPEGLPCDLKTRELPGLATLSSKYIRVAGGRADVPYITAQGQPGGPAVVVEGTTDALIAAQVLPDAWRVLTPGSATDDLKPEAVAGNSLILLAFDNDEAGQAAKARAIEALRNAERLADVRIVAYPDGTKDASEYVCQGGDLLALLMSAQPIEGPAGPIDELYTYANRIGVRSALLYSAPQFAAPFYALLACRNLLPQSFTMPQAQDILTAARYSIGKKYLYALASHSGAFVSKTLLLFQTPDNPNNESETKAPSSGRWAFCYRLPTLAEFKQFLADRLEEKITRRVWPHHIDEPSAPTERYDPDGELIAYARQVDQQPGQEDRKAEYRRLYEHWQRTMQADQTLDLSPARCANAVDMRRQAAHAIIKDTIASAGVCALRASELAPMLGLHRPQSVGSVLKRSAVTNTKQPCKDTVVSGPLDYVLIRTVNGEQQLRGNIRAIYAECPDGGRVYWSDRKSGKIESWRQFITRQQAQGNTIHALINQPNIQTINPDATIERHTPRQPVREVRQPRAPLAPGIARDTTPFAFNRASWRTRGILLALKTGQVWTFDATTPVLRRVDGAAVVPLTLRALHSLLGDCAVLIDPPDERSDQSASPAVDPARAEDVTDKYSDCTDKRAAIMLLAQRTGARIISEAAR